MLEVVSKFNQFNSIVSKRGSYPLYLPPETIELVDVTPKRSRRPSLHRPPPAKLLIVIIACCNSKLLFHPILPTTAIISPLFVHGYTIPASKGEPVVLIPIALHGDTDSLDGAINAPGVDMGKV